MITFKHQNTELPMVRGTMAFQLPPKEILTEMMNGFYHSIVIPFGYTIVHEKDQYNKKIGRELSLSKVRNTLFYLENMRPTFNNEIRKLIFELHAEVNFSGRFSKVITLGLSIVNESDNVHLEYAYIE